MSNHFFEKSSHASVYPRPHAPEIPAEARGDSAATKSFPRRSTYGGMTVNELAQSAGVTVYVVRHYTRIGLLTPMRHPHNGYKIFRETHVRRLRFIQQAKALGFSLSEVRRILQDAEQGKSPCPRVRDLVATRIKENRRKLEELIVLQRRMEDAQRRWEMLPDRVPNDDTVCHLIESFDDVMACSAAPARRT
jgi:MerR family Zn(II)-responsive transcriptional regulator of zntA